MRIDNTLLYTEFRKSLCFEYSYSSMDTNNSKTEGADAINVSPLCFFGLLYFRVLIHLCGNRTAGSAVAG